MNFRSNVLPLKHLCRVDQGVKQLMRKHMSLSRAWRLLRTSKRDNTKALACPTDLFDLGGEKISPSLFYMLGCIAVPTG